MVDRISACNSPSGISLTCSWHLSRRVFSLLFSPRVVGVLLRDLPIRWAELGTVYRYERSGTLHGLMRVRGFTQDDAHIFCLPEQLEDEIISVLDLTETILSRFGFDR